MQTLTFIPGRAYMVSDSPTARWAVVFEDEGVAGYFYACDRSRGEGDQSILDAMLIYNVASLGRNVSGPDEAALGPGERIVAVEWSRDGLKAVLYLDGTAQALFDFGARRGYCRMNFPNFVSERGETWNKSSHAWSEQALEEFEAALYA